MSYSVICPSCHEKNSGNFLVCQKCQTSLLGIPREEFPPSSLNLTTQKTDTLQKEAELLAKISRAKLFRLFVTSFGVACVIGLIVAYIGSMGLDWNSRIQFSNGFFYASVVVAAIGYYNYRNEQKIQHEINMLYSQTAGSMDISERRKLWSTDEKNSYKAFFYLILVSAYLFGFAIIIWNIF